MMHMHRDNAARPKSMNVNICIVTMRITGIEPGPLTWKYSLQLSAPTPPEALNRFETRFCVIQFICYVGFDSRVALS